MEMRGKKSSYKKALIVLSLAFIVIGVLWIIYSASAGVVPVDIDVENQDELVSVEQDFTSVSTQRLTITAKEIEIEMFVGQIAEIEFETSADFADAIVINEKGEIIGSCEFARGRGNIDFLAGGKRVVIILSPGDDNNYGSNGGRQEFLRECERYNARTREQIIDIILGNSIEIAGSGDTAGVIVVKTKIVQPEITDISGEWDEYELEITGQSNLPRRTEIEWKIFEKTGTARAGRNGKISFDIDLDGIDTSGSCILEMRVMDWLAEFEIDASPEPTEQVMSIKPKASPLPSPRIAPTTPTTTPTPKITRVLADPPTEIADDIEKAREELAEKSELTKILETEVKWVPEIATFIIAMAALLILRYKMKK